MSLENIYMVDISLDEIWHEIASTSTPLAHKLKFEIPHKWLRFHSLPHSKRYPENKLELQNIIERHNQVLSSVFHQDEPLFILMTEWSNSDKTERKALDWIHWQSGKSDPNDDKSGFWHIYWKPEIWKPGLLDDVIVNAANEILSNHMTIGISSKVIYHPYDGGMDLVFADEARMISIKKKFHGYLSTHPEGL